MLVQPSFVGRRLSCYGNLGLEKLFKEETNMLSTNEDLNIKELFKEETNMLNTNEDLNIDKLFQEDGMFEQNKQ